MISQPASQPDKILPQFDEPVKCKLDVKVFYDTGDRLIESNPEIYCSEIFADTVLKSLNQWCLKYDFSIIHIGVYNPRPARKKNGTEIKPKRWSNHAYGLAVDFKGILDNQTNKIYRIQEMKNAIPAKVVELIANINKSIKQKSRKPEIVDEGGWFHFGIWKQ